MVFIRDIAIGLSHQSHFNGQSPRFFSIAQHSVMVLERFETINPEALPSIKLLALLHDAPEAYTGDIVKPLKVLLPEFKEIEHNIMRAICCRFAIPMAYLPEIKPYDLEVQNLEYEGFYNEGEIEFWSCKLAYHRFMAEFDRLTKDR
jgi:5'-deoxynucleotidase YfbR-like HD superfamily hydrolase